MYKQLVCHFAKLAKPVLPVPNEVAGQVMWTGGESEWWYLTGTEWVGTDNASLCLYLHLFSNSLQPLLTLQLSLLHTAWYNIKYFCEERVSKIHMLSALLVQGIHRYFIFRGSKMQRGVKQQHYASPSTKIVIRCEMLRHWCKLSHC